MPSYNNKVSSAYFDEESTYATQSYKDYIKGLGFVPREGTYSSKKISSKNEIIYDVIYNIGKDNFRKSLFEGKPSIHLFGGSMTFGEGLNDNQTLSYYLSKNYNLKTKNFGVHGYGIEQSEDNVKSCIKKGQSVYQGNLDDCLSDFMTNDTTADFIRPCISITKS